METVITKNTPKAIFFHFGGAYCVLFCGIVKGDHDWFEGSGPSCINSRIVALAK
jgi:hypothetical protein